MKHTCPACGGAWEIADSSFGRKVECPHCGATSFAGFSAGRAPAPSPPAPPPLAQVPTAAAVAQGPRPAQPRQVAPGEPPAPATEPQTTPGYWAEDEQQDDDSAEATRTCEYCAELIPEEALCCPRCTRWRSDIVRLRRNILVCRATAAACALCAVIIFVQVERSSRHGELGFEGSLIWHEKVSRPAMTPEGRRFFGPAAERLQTYEREFSVPKFLHSIEGWIVVLLGIGCIVMGIAGICLAGDLKRETRGLETGRFP